MAAVLAPLPDRVRHLPLARDQLQALLDQHRLQGQAPLQPQEGAGLGSGSGLDLVPD